MTTDAMRRIEELAARERARPDSRLRLRLASLPDDDVDFLAAVAEHVLAGGEVAGLGPDTVARIDAIDVAERH